MARDQIANPRLQVLNESGVSIRLDTRSREILDTGEFARLVAEYSVTGAPGRRVATVRSSWVGER